MKPLKLLIGKDTTMLLAKPIAILYDYFLLNVRNGSASFPRDTASETVRTLLVYGYNLDPPTGEAQEGNHHDFVACSALAAATTSS